MRSPMTHPHCEKTIAMEAYYTSPLCFEKPLKVEGGEQRITLEQNATEHERLSPPLSLFSISDLCWDVKFKIINHDNLHEFTQLILINNYKAS